MFRYFAQRKAKEIGIVGTVENLSDGSVRVIVQGNKESLLKFISHLKKGPISAKVRNVLIKWGKAKGFLSDFKIIF